MLSACLIARDEEEQLPRCLESIASVADEIVLCVDDRTTDRTAEIGREYGATVAPFKWTDDFAGARNLSIEKATGKWILVIDPDEELDATDALRIKALIEEVDQKPEVTRVEVIILSETEDGWSRFPSVRLFRKGNERYGKIAHNALSENGKYAVSRVRIYHYGYNLSPEKMMVKYKRTERLLKIQIDENPRGSVAWRNLVRNYRAQGRYEEAIEAATHVLDMVDDGVSSLSPTSHQMVLTDLAAAYEMEKLPDEAEATLRVLVEDHGANIDARYMLGTLCSAQERHTEAIEYLSRYIELVEEAQSSIITDPVIVDSWGYVAKAYNTIGISHYALDQHQDALQEFRNAVRLEPTEMGYHDNMERALSELTDGDPLNVLFVQTAPCARNRKEAIALAKKGHRVTLAYTAVNAYEDENIYAEAIKITDYAQLWPLCQKYDIVHVHNEPDSLAAMIAEYVPGVILIHDSHDSIELRNRENPSLHVISAMANRRSTARIYCSPQQLAMVRMMYGVDMETSIILYNFIAEGDIGPVPNFVEIPSFLQTSPGEYYIVYAGGLGAMHRDMKDIFKAIADRGVHLHIYPSFEAKEYREMAENHDYLHYHDTVPPGRLIQELSMYDFGLISWNIKKSNKQFLDICIANKLYEYAAAGLPVISARTAALEWAIEKYELGMVYDSVDDIIGGLDDLAKLDMAGKLFTWESQIDKLIGLYRMLLRDREKQATGKEVLERAMSEVLHREYLTQRIKVNERSAEYGFLFQSLAKCSPERVLDVGPGETALPALIRNCGYHTTALDNWGDYWENGCSNNHFYVLDDDIREPVKLDGQKFDFVSCISTLEHIEDHSLAIQSMFNLLNPGGHIALTVPYNEIRYIDDVYKEPGISKEVHYKCHVFSRAQVDGWLKENNAEVVEQEYWSVFDGGLWRLGERLSPPLKLDASSKHDLTCLLLHKREEIT